VIPMVTNGIGSQCNIQSEKALRDIDSACEVRAAPLFTALC
jgi:hypothetical protein